MTLFAVLDTLAPAVISVMKDSKFSFASLEYLSGLRILVDFDPTACTTSVLSLPFMVTRMFFFYATNFLVYIFNIKQTFHGISDVARAAAVSKHGSFRERWIAYAINGHSSSGGGFSLRPSPLILEMSLNMLIIL